MKITFEFRGRIIIREGLIILAISAALYLIVTFFLQNVTAELPRYRLEFGDGKIYTISINPEIRNDYNYKKLLEETYNPPPKLVEKRIKEFIRAGNIKSALKSSACVNSKRIYVSRLYSYLLGVTFILKIAIIYLVLLFARFIIWAVKALKKPGCAG